MRTDSVSIDDVQKWNDTFALQFDIDDYYSKASVLVRWVTKLRLRAIKTLVGANPHDRILEVGCGGGHILRMFPENNLVGVDVSGEMIQKSERNLRDYNVTLLRGELHQVDLPRDGFDRVICSEVLEHVVDPGALIATMARLVAPDGKLVVTVPNDAWIDGIKAIVRKTGLQFIPPFRNITWGGDQYHLHQWTKREMIADLAKHFSVERVAVAPFAAIPLHYAFACKLRRS